jgi:hypothetical protein
MKSVIPEQLSIEHELRLAIKKLEAEYQTRVTQADRCTASELKRALEKEIGREKLKALAKRIKALHRPVVR